MSDASAAVCSECGVELIGTATGSRFATEWICQQCSGAVLSDFIDDDNDNT